MKTELYVLSSSGYIDRERVEEQGLFSKEQMLLLSFKQTK